MENLKDKTLEELQALAYQNLVNIQAYQRGLEVIEKEIASRQTEPEK